MKALLNSIVLLVLLISMPALIYYMYIKTYTKKAHTYVSINNTIQIKNAEIARLKKENAELKAREVRPLAQPPRRFGQGAQSANPTSESPLSQPPRRIGSDYSYPNSYREHGHMNRSYKEAQGNTPFIAD